MVIILTTENWLIFECNIFIDCQVRLKIGKCFGGWFGINKCII